MASLVPADLPSPGFGSPDGGKRDFAFRPSIDSITPGTLAKPAPAPSPAHHSLALVSPITPHRSSILSPVPRPRAATVPVSVFPLRKQRSSGLFSPTGVAAAIKPVVFASAVRVASPGTSGPTDAWGIPCKESRGSTSRRSSRERDRSDKGDVEMSEELREVEYNLKREIEKGLLNERKIYDREREASYLSLKELIVEQVSSLNNLLHNNDLQTILHESVKTRVETLESELPSQFLQRLTCVEKDVRDLFNKIGGGPLNRADNEIIIKDALQHHMDDLKQNIDANHNNLAVSVERLAAERQVLEERVKLLQSRIGDSADEHGRALEDIHKKMEDVSGKVHSSLQMNLALERDALKSYMTQHVEGVVGETSESTRLNFKDVHARIEKHTTAMEDNIQLAQAKIDEFHSHLEKQQTLVTDKALETAAEVGDKLKEAEMRICSQVDQHISNLNNRFVTFEEGVHESSVADKESKSSLQDRHAHLNDRVDFIERLLGASADKHDNIADQLNHISSAIEKHWEQLGALEEHANDVEAYHESCATLSHEEKTSLDDHLQTLTSNHGEHAKNLEALKDAHTKQIEMLNDLRAEHREGLSQLRTEHSAGTQSIADLHSKLGELQLGVTSCASVGRHDSKTTADIHEHQDQKLGPHHEDRNVRLDYLQRLVEDLASKHETKLEVLASNQAMTANELHSAMADQHESVTKRFGEVENAIKDSAKAIASVNSRSDRLQTRMENCERTASSCSAVVSPEPISTAICPDSIEPLLDVIRQRMNRLESAMSDCVGTQAAQIDKVKALYATTVTELQTSQTQMASWSRSYEEKLTSLGSSFLQAAALQNTGAKAGTQIPPAVLAVTTAKLDHHEREMKAISEQLGKHKEETQRARDVHVGLVSENMVQAETKFSDIASKHRSELEAATRNHDELCARVAACESQHSSLAELKRGQTNLGAQKAELKEHHSSLKDHVESLERVLQESNEKHAKELDQLKSSHRKLASDSQVHQNKASGVVMQEKLERETHHGAMLERLNKLEKSVGDSKDAHANLLKTNKAALEQLANETNACQNHQSGLQQHLQILEVSLGVSAETGPLSKEVGARMVDSLFGTAGCAGTRRVAFQKLENAPGIDVISRIGFLESALGESAETAKHTSQFDPTLSCPVLKRLGVVERSIDDLRTSQESLACGVEFKLNMVKQAWSQN